MSDLFLIRRQRGPWASRRESRWRGPLRGVGRFLAYSAFGACLAGGLILYERWPSIAAIMPDMQATTPDAAPHAPAPSPRYTAVDGDSLRAGGEDIRLLGIDAPELSQTCGDARGRPWPCGRAAHDLLKTLVATGPVRCTPQGQDRYGRTLARCSAGPVADIGEALVREGLALDYMQGGYKAAESEARAAKRGVWVGEFELPQEHRRRMPRRAQAN